MNKNLTQKEYNKNYYLENKERMDETSKKWINENREYCYQYSKEYRRSDKGIETRNRYMNNNPFYQLRQERFIENEIEQIEANGDYCSNTVQYSSYLNDPVDLDHYSIELMECC